MKSLSRFTQTGLLLFFMTLAALPLAAQSNAPAISDRYLFIVDQSAAMRRRAPAVQKAVLSLFTSSLLAEMRTGDSVGVWTFNEQLQAGKFPLHNWSPDNNDEIAANVIKFLRAQTNGGQSRFEVVLPVLRQVVAESPRLTILLISDGDERISGTPFDREIERALSSKYEQQQRARMPFITVLRAARGRIASATVNMAPWPVEFPKFPPEPAVVEAPKPKPEPTNAPPVAPRAVVPPLIVIGKKPPTNALPVVATNSPAVTTNATQTNAAAVVTPPGDTIVPSTQPTNPPAAATPIVVAATNVAVPINVVTNEPPPVVTAAVTTESPPINAPTLTAPSNTPALVGGTVAAAPNSTPAETIESTPPSTQATVVTSNRTQVVPPLAAQQILTTPESTKESPGPIARLENLDPAAPTKPPVSVAAATSRGGISWTLIAVGVVPILLGIAAFFYLQRRERTVGHGSLISKSLDRDKK